MGAPVPPRRREPPAELERHGPLGDGDGPSESGYSKMRKISVSAMDGVLVGRRERIHSGVLI